MCSLDLGWCSDCHLSPRYYEAGAPSSLAWQAGGGARGGAQNSSAPLIQVRGGIVLLATQLAASMVRLGVQAYPGQRCPECNSSELLEKS